LRHITMTPCFRVIRPSICRLFRARRLRGRSPGLKTCMCLASVIRRRFLRFGGFQSVARSGQKSIAQGLPWVNSPTGMSPEGAGRYGGNWLRTSGLDRLHIFSSPFRAKRLFRLTQGKPWAKLSCPFGAGRSGRKTGAKLIRKPGLSPQAPSGHSMADAKHIQNPGYASWPLRATDWNVQSPSGRMSDAKHLPS
jgi:hypothetical protein